EKLAKKAVRARVEGQMHIESAGENVFAWDEAPIATIFAVVAAVTHHEVFALGDFDRFGYAIDRPRTHLEIVTGRRPFGVVIDAIPRARRFRFDIDDGQFGFGFRPAESLDERALLRQLLAVNDDAASFNLNR